MGTPVFECVLSAGRRFPPGRRDFFQYARVTED
jgi:hypothetical protein